MAEIILSPLIDAAIEYLISTIKDEFHLVWGVKQELEDLNSTLSAINGVLADAEEKQVKEKGVRDWLKKLKHVAYEVDNVLDEYAIEALRRQVEQTTETSNFQVSDLLSCVSDILSCVCFKRVVFRHSIGNKIRNINTRLKKINEERSDYHLIEGAMERKKVEIIETYSFVDQKTVLGRETEKQRVRDMLVASTSSSDGDDVFVIPIVGLGGMGKTTLAQFIYNDDKVEKHFHLRLWVCVSLDFDIKRLIRAIIKSNNPSNNTLETLELEPLQVILREMLHGKRFLLVLDDVWNENQDEWESLKKLLKGGGAKGSRILVTTRSHKVSSIMGTTTPIILEGIPDDDCLQLFLKRKIIDMLIASTSSSSDGDDVFVIPIVGLGGMGKTTLAQFIYNDDKVEKHFHLRLWVCVSVDFDIKRLIRAIIKSDNSLETLESLQGKLREMLHGKRFLLVLDDVWNENHDEWEKLMNLLRGGANGSRILVTTRSHKVSSIMGTTTSPIVLKGLEDADCLRLFLQRAFSVNEVEAFPRLQEIGSDIVKKCKGVPLAAKTLGSLMRFKRRDESEWMHVRDSETWGLPDDENTILNALRISYNHLPSHLKQCFSYCSLYPKDYDIEPKILIRVWMAQGYIQQPSKEQSSKQVEDIGMDYFNDLLWRSFFQDVERNPLGNIESCKMHDLMHDLAQAIAKEECFIIKVGKSSSEEEVISANQQQEAYHLSLDSDGAEASTSIPNQLYRCSNIRTLAGSNILTLAGIEAIDDNLFSSLKCLRVLDLSGSGIRKLPDSIENLKHLKYLGLGRTGIERLPETICSLCNLQTLDISACFDLRELPKGLKKMVSLRHLEFQYTNEFECMPSGMGRLTSLQTLSKYIVGKNTSGCVGIGLGELQDLNLLRGELEICNLENAKKNDAYKANLKNKQHLDTLVFSWNSPRPIINVVEEEEEEEGILESLQPHPSLKRLVIENYGGAKFPSWMAAANSSSSSLPNLLSLRLEDFHNDKLTSLPNGLLQNLTALQFLTLGGMPYVDSLPESVESLSALEELRIVYCDRLESLPEGLKRLSKLERLSIARCPLLTERCKEGGEDWHKIAHVRTILIDYERIT